MVMNQGIKAELKGVRLARVIKQKMTAHYVPSFLTAEERQLRGTPANLFGHQCTSP